MREHLLPTKIVNSYNATNSETLVYEVIKKFYKKENAIDNATLVIVPN